MVSIPVKSAPLWWNESNVFHYLGLLDQIPCTDRGFRLLIRYTDTQGAVTQIPAIPAHQTHAFPKSTPDCPRDRQTGQTGRRYGLRCRHQR